MGNGTTIRDTERTVRLMFQYPMGNGTQVAKKVKLTSKEYVSIPYGKWNQQQLVVGAIIAYNSMHVKGFPQKNILIT